MAFFTNYYRVTEETLNKYGAFNISLINDLPLFIDPFLIYGSDKPKYKQLHDDILQYLGFLRDKCVEGDISEAELSSWFMFREVKQNWLGFSVVGNGGNGLGKDFASSMSRNMDIIFADLNNEKISDTSHLEKATLFHIGVGKDHVSDFTCNLIKSFLLDYTQEFATKHLDPSYTKTFSVEKAYFDYEAERWMAKSYILPINHIDNDFVLLTPVDILTKDETWINGNDLRGDFIGICATIPNEQLRGEINRFYLSKLPPPKYIGKGRNRRAKKPTQREKAIAVQAALTKYPEILDYYIKVKEQNKQGAKSISQKRRKEVEEIFFDLVNELIKLLDKETSFYTDKFPNSYQESLNRVHYLKDVIENKDGYKVFYYKGQPIQRESDLTIMFRLTWYGTSFDVNTEVNNGRGPADFIASKGSRNKSLVEFKLASNSKLKMNLENQTQIYKAASNAQKAIKVILYFNLSEKANVERIMQELGLTNDESIILIDASNNKPSASNVRSTKK